MTQKVFVDLSISFLQIKHLNIGGIKKILLLLFYQYLAFLALFLLSLPAHAEVSAVFNSLDFYFYGDLDNGNGNISTVHPISDTDTVSDCPQSANRLSWPGQDRQWETVGSWVTEFQTPGEVASGDYTFTIWANSTQGTVEDVQFRISVSIGGGTADAVETSHPKPLQILAKAQHVLT